MKLTCSKKYFLGGYLHFYVLLCFLLSSKDETRFQLSTKPSSFVLGSAQYGRSIKKRKNATYMNKK